MEARGNQIVIDATDGVLGRVASFAAKQAMFGKKIFVVNCGNVLITGRKQNIIHSYEIARAKGGSSQKGPHFPKTPERIMKRTIRGMLSYKKGRGLDAFKNIRCYNNTPPELESHDKISLKKEVKVRAIKLSEVSGKI
jgi:large subunit ribosomal protein L13